MPTAHEIRKPFIDYFVERCGHTFVPSSPCVPHDDPTLMFTNAGMNQFKDVFLGTGTRPYSRAANSQKCIRAGGKHNDLDDVGHDTYHHTFFEMLGNWSFGDYFKKEAIEWAWDLLTNVWGLDKRRLHATYFGGNVKTSKRQNAKTREELEPDFEARDLWLSVTDIDPANVHPGSMKDNFWEMGDTGPCGPCSEIHIDLTPDLSGRRLVNAGDARVIEIWNLVFIQFNRGADGKLTPLPARHVDTGMGFERITAVIQGMAAGRLGEFGNYDTDIFTSIFEAIRAVTGAPAYAGLLENHGDGEKEAGASRSAVMRDVAYRVVADHIRTLTFAITDGAVPSNEKRGFVLRRILRRAVRYGWQYLNMKEPFLHKLVPVVVETMGGAFPELRAAHGGKNVGRIAEIIREEEASFGRTLDRGIALFEEAAAYAMKHHHGRISGEDAFKLHDTYGFPIDLTELMAQERGLTVNIGEYERLMEEAREKARSQKTRSLADEPWIVERLGVHHSPTRFVGYSKLKSDAIVDSILIPDKGEVGEIGEGEVGAVILDQTPFYAERGGQVGDRGWIVSDSGRFLVEHTIQVNDRFLHIGKCERGVLRSSSFANVAVSVPPGGPGPRPAIAEHATAEVDAAFRVPTMKNHTATHVMNWALREVLGDHVQQKGSLVDPDKTRFDLSHPAPITEVQLARIEAHVNRLIEADLPVYTQVVEQEKARKINTLRAVFGEKYPDKVRVVSIGVPVDELLSNPENPEWMNYSVEFCGGTHLKRTGEAKKFRLIEESAVAKGIRRVVGITGERALDGEARARALARLLAEAATVAEAALPNRIAEITAEINQTELPVVERMRLRADLEHLQARAKQFAKQAAKAEAADVMGRVADLLTSAEKVGSVSLIAASLGSASVDQLRAAADSLRDRAGSAAVFLAAEDAASPGKVILLAAMTPDVVVRGVKAGDVVKAIAPVVGGRGGGRPDMAQGGGSEVGHVEKAVREAAEWLRAKLSE